MSGIATALSVIDQGILIVSTLRERAAALDLLVKQAQVGLIPETVLAQKIMEMESNLKTVEEMWRLATETNE